jgi:hypothetical protein
VASPAPAVFSAKPHLFGVLAGLFLAVGLVVAAVAFTRTWVHLRESNVIVVTGSARLNVRSDLVVWNAVLQAEGKTLPEAYAKFQRDAETLRAFLSARGITGYTWAPVVVKDIKPESRKTVLDLTESDDASSVTPRTGYRLDQAIQVSSADVAGVPRLAADSLALLADGVVLQTEKIEFIYTKLAETRVQMMAEATADARRRAEEIAGKGGRRLDRLRSAKMGVVQVNALHGTETSWEGNLDTSALNKTITTTVSAEFALR